MTSAHSCAGSFQSSATIHFAGGYERGKQLTSLATNQPPLRTGRPRTACDIRELVLRFARENSWDYTRILGELRKLGITQFSRQTVKAILKAQGIVPTPDRGGGTWTEFIRIHADTLWLCDFLTKPIWTPKGLVNQYVLAFLHIGSRRLWLSPATRSPDTAWLSEQAEGFLAHAQSVNLPATIMLWDNDVKYPPEFDTVLKSAGLDFPQMPVRAPNVQAQVERVIQTLQHEAFDRMVVVAERHLNFIIRNLQDWYNSQPRPRCTSPSGATDECRTCEAHKGFSVYPLLVSVRSWITKSRISSSVRGRPGFVRSLAAVAYVPASSATPQEMNGAINETTIQHHATSV